MSSESLRSFYSGKSLFVTGATGFLGRLLLAKLMRMGNLKEILILSRPKKGNSNEERLNKILSGFLFEDIEKYDSKFKEKLKIINGDMEAENLGISNSDREYIKNNAQIIIHCAATVKFDELLRKAIKINVKGTKSLLDLAIEVKNLESFVHVSTAFSNCPRSEISEVFYKPPIDYNLALDLVNNFDDEFVNCLTAKLINPWPNTYTFTKAISEDMIRQYETKLPIVIIRPSLVQGTFIDPVPGFTDTIVGFLGFGLGYMLGALRVMHIPKPKNKLNMVPADFVINSMLAVGYENLTKEIEPKIFNCVTDELYVLSFERIVDFAAKLSHQSPSKKMIWWPHLKSMTCSPEYKLLFFICHYIPAYIGNIILRYHGSKLNVVNIYTKIYLQINSYEYFMKKNLSFPNQKMQTVYSRMSQPDQIFFPTQISSCDASYQYIIDVFHGLKKYIFKETDQEESNNGTQKIKVLKLVYYASWSIIYFFSAYYFLSIFQSFFGNVSSVHHQLMD